MTVDEDLQKIARLAIVMNNNEILRTAINVFSQSLETVSRLCFFSESVSKNTTQRITMLKKHEKPF
jgi:hypothetical protein